MKFVQWEPSCSMWTDGWTNRWTDSTRLIVAFRNFQTRQIRISTIFFQLFLFFDILLTVHPNIFILILTNLMY